MYIRDLLNHLSAMGINGVMEKSLKRSADDCNEDLTDLKMKKLEEVSSCDNEQSSSQLSSGSELSNESTSNSETTNSQSSFKLLKYYFTDTSFKGYAEVQTVDIKLFSLTSPKKNFEELKELKLTKGKVFEQMMLAFLNVEPPQQISYGKLKYELIYAYAEFWENLYSSPEYTTGTETKLLNSSLDKLSLQCIARILKRGWEDERFFPKRLAKPFLEACIFNIESEDELVFKPEIFYKYIEKEERKIIESRESTTIDRENIKVFQKYYPGAPISIGDTIESACKKVLGKIMFKDVENVRRVWTEELVGLLKFEQFKFLEERQSNIPLESEVDVACCGDCTIAPHRLWSTFFYKWDERMKQFYFKLLQNRNFASCKICGSCDVDTKHIVTTKEGDPKRQTTQHFKMLTHRHNIVLSKIVKQIKVALERGHNSILGKENWKLVVMDENYRKPWPQELAMLEPLNLFPHIVLYCTFPRKLAMIIELTVPWDHWATHGSIHYSKKRKYSKMVETLTYHGFIAKYFDVNVGARGVWSEELYNLFDQLCGMKRSEITKTMEKISKIIIEVAYNFQYKYSIQ